MNAGGVQHGRRLTSFMRLSLYKSPSLATEKEETEQEGHKAENRLSTHGHSILVDGRAKLSEVT